MQTPRLIQRGEIADPIKDPRTPLFQAVFMHFMGPADYGPWAWRKSLRHLATHAEFGVLTSVNILEQSGRLHVYHTFSSQTKDFEKYFEYLMEMRIGKLQPLVRSHFAIAKEEDRRSTDFWWDLDNNVMWSFNETFMTGLKDNIQESYKLILDADSKGS